MRIETTPVLIILCITITWYVYNVYLNKRKFETFTHQYQSQYMQKHIDTSASLRSSLEFPKTLKFKRCNKYVFPQVEENVVQKLQKVEDKSWDLWLPCGYTDIEQQLSENDHFKTKLSGSIALGIDGADNFAAKDRLWAMLKKYYGQATASIYMPPSWITYDQTDLADFYTYARDHPKDLFIMKKNLQRQEGLHIFSNPLEAKDAYSKDYVVIQKVLDDPYLLDNRKVNIRVYVLIVCKYGVRSLYVYDDGFIYYSKVKYTEGTKGKTRDEIITTGYVDRAVYEINPLTTQDFFTYIDKNYGNGTSSNFISQRDAKLLGIMKAAGNSFCVADKGNMTFAQIYGVDIQPNKDLSDLHILEWNKGADLSVKDNRDGKVKQAMIDDLYRVLGLVQDEKMSGWKLVGTV